MHALFHILGDVQDYFLAISDFHESPMFAAPNRLALARMSHKIEDLRSFNCHFTRQGCGMKCSSDPFMILQVQKIMIMC